MSLRLQVPRRRPGALLLRSGDHHRGHGRAHLCRAHDKLMLSGNFRKVMHMQTDYSGAWRDLRKRTITLWVVFFSYLPGVAFLNFAFGPSLATLTGIKQNNVALMIALCWMIAFAISGFRLWLFRCPSCGKMFFSGSRWENPFAWKCMHCGLPKWTREDQPSSN
jgi:hypothetical protein